jgi:ribosomal-protein-alanine N-acetyltransferase
MATARIEASRRLAKAGESLPFAVETKHDGQCIGWVTVNRNTQDSRHASFGYWLGEKHQGKGYMRETIPVLISAIFQLWDVDTIEAAAQPGNVASLAVLLRAGMKFSHEGMVYAPARQREELCHFYEMKRADTSL